MAELSSNSPYRFDDEEILEKGLSEDSVSVPNLPLKEQEEISQVGSKSKKKMIKKRVKEKQKLYFMRFLYN